MKHYEVIIAGGGPSGIAAAVYAARNGADTLLIEREGTIGGMSTSGDINCWCGEASSGFFKELYPLSSKEVDTRTVFDPEVLKWIYPDMLSQAGADILLNTLVCGAEAYSGRIKSVTVYAKGKRFDLEADIFVDSTGDGDLAFLTGVPFEMGRESDGVCQPCSLMFMVGSVNEEKAVYPGFGTHKEYQDLMERAVRDGKIPGPAGHIIAIKGYRPGTAGINMTVATDVDAADIESLTRAELLTRRQVPAIVDFLRQNLPGYENCYVISSGNRIGIRESRRFKGDYCLSQEDIQSNKIFDDWIVSRVNYLFNNHNLKGCGPDESSKTPYNHKGYTIPYGCLLPAGMENLYLNGRNISGTHMAHASYRVMVPCFAIGQAAGTAASLAVKGGGIRTVDVKQVQSLLAAQGVTPP